MSDAKRKPRTDEQLTEVEGLLDMRRNMTMVFNAARAGKEVTITEYGFDREVNAVYKLIRVED